MGCDIHFHAEVKLNDRWEHADEISIDRSYEFFGKLVTNHPRCRGEEGAAEARGVPGDANDYTKHLMACVDYHTHSWLTRKEVESIPDLEDYSSELYYWLQYYNEELPLRFVFAFDN